VLHSDVYEPLFWSTILARTFESMEEAKSLDPVADMCRSSYIPIDTNFTVQIRLLHW
jgi:hypothetical protein